MTAGRWLCRAEEVPEGGGRDVRLGSGTELRSILVTRRKGALYAYENSCPHLGTPLNLLPDQFFDCEGKYLLCRTHGALFHVESGLCISGPCLGQSLRPVAIHVEDGEVVIA